MSSIIEGHLKIAIEQRLYQHLESCENLSDLMTEDVSKASKELFSKIEEKYGKDMQVLLAATVTLQGTLMRDLISLALTKATTGLNIELSVERCGGIDQLANVIMEATTDYLVGVSNSHHKSFEKHVRIALDGRNKEGKRLLVEIIGMALTKSKEMREQS